TPNFYNGVQVSLVSPSGAVVRSGDAFSDSGPFVLGEDGEYFLIVRALVAPDATEYSFRLLDLAAAEPLALDTETSGVLDPGQGNRFFTFQGVEGQRVYFDRLAGSTFTGAALYGAGSSALATGGSEFETTLTADGRYYLVLSGGRTTPADYLF